MSTAVCPRELPRRFNTRVCPCCIRVFVPCANVRTHCLKCSKAGCPSSLVARCSPRPHPYRGRI